MKCLVCGKDINEEELIFEKKVNQKMNELQLCFDCLFWTEYVEDVSLPESVRVNGHHYVICEENSTNIRGHGGVKIVIEFFNGRRVTTTNLWAQGPIPERFRDRLPDNADFTK